MAPLKGQKLLNALRCSTWDSRIRCVTEAHCTYLPSDTLVLSSLGDLRSLHGVTCGVVVTEDSIYVVRSDDRSEVFSERRSSMSEMFYCRGDAGKRAVGPCVLGFSGGRLLPLSVVEGWEKFTMTLELASSLAKVTDLDVPDFLKLMKNGDPAMPTPEPSVARFVSVDNSGPEHTGAFSELAVAELEARMEVLESQSSDRTVLWHEAHLDLVYHSEGLLDLNALSTQCVSEVPSSEEAEEVLVAAERESRYAVRCFLDARRERDEAATAAQRELAAKERNTLSAQLQDERQQSGALIAEAQEKLRAEALLVRKLRAELEAVQQREQQVIERARRREAELADRLQKLQGAQ